MKKREFLPTRRAIAGFLDAYRSCEHKAQYRFAVRVLKDGTVTFGKLGTNRNTHVVADWCERCGSIAVRPSVRDYPIARVSHG